VLCVAPQPLALPIERQAAYSAGMNQRGKPTPPKELGLDSFQAIPDESGYSLDELSRAYAALMGEGSDPYAAQAGDSQTEREDVGTTAKPPAEREVHDRPAADDQVCPVTPRSIVEALLFVGHPDNVPLTSKQVAATMRGVRPEEVDEIVAELNGSYASEGAPYAILSEGAGYRLALRQEFAPLRDRFFGRMREARLSQAAIDVLSIVAYHQPLTRDEVDRLRGKPSSGVLTQLVRRQLVRIERDREKPRKPRYCTSPRFLELFGLTDLAELPRSQELS